MTQFRAPGRYVQGEGALESADEHFARLDASRVVVAGGETALSTVEAELDASLEAAGIERRGSVRGIEQSTEERIDQVATLTRETAVDAVVGVGGTTATDAAKAAAIRTDATFVAVPTLASADGPAGGVAVRYDDSGRPAGVALGEENPALILVDTAVVADAPAEFLRWGIGDSVSTLFEVEACRAAGGTTIHGVEPAATAIPLARQVYENLAEYGADALAAVERGEVTRAVETIVETIHLTSVLAWENGGLAGPHALESGLRLSGITDPPHGPLVALCTLASAVWQDHPETDDLASLLASLGFEDPLPPDADLDAGATMAEATGMLENEPREVTPELAVESLETARELLADAGD